MQIQFSGHAIERLLGRLSKVVSYGEVQAELSRRQLRDGDHRVLVKKLPTRVKIEDDSAINKQVQGDKVFALVHVKQGGCNVDTVALSD